MNTWCGESGLELFKHSSVYISPCHATSHSLLLATLAHSHQIPPFNFISS
jgi:hypothetical protein